MISPTVTRHHVEQAIAHVRRDGVPPRRKARRYALVVNGERLPPKYVLAVAIELATGRAPTPDDFGGGTETNTFLQRLGFRVIDTTAPPRRTQLRVARVFLDLGIRQGAYRARPEGKAAAFTRLSRAAFTADPDAYVARIVGLLHQARGAGSTVVALPACALQLSKRIPLDAYAVPELPYVVAGGATAEGEFAVVVREGQSGIRFDASRVWACGGDGFSMRVAISSTIGQAIEAKHHPPIASPQHPPSSVEPVLIVDVGHAQYSSRYDFNTLRCVARDVAARTDQPAAVVLSSWMWSTRGIGPRWCHPAERIEATRHAGRHGDWLDVLDVDLT